MYLSLLTLPIISSILIGFIGRKVGITGNNVVTCICVLFSSILTIIAISDVGLYNSFVNIPVST